MAKGGKQWAIWLDGNNICVSEEVYRAYYRPEWREAKREKVRKEWEYSLDCWGSNDSELSSPDMLVEELVSKRLLIDKLYLALGKLTNEERELIIALYFHGKTGGDLAKANGVTKQNISYHRKRIIDKLHNILKAEK